MAAPRINFCWLSVIVVLVLNFHTFTKPSVAISLDAIKTNSKESNENNGIFTTNPRSILSGRGWRSIYGVGQKMPKISRSKIPIELDLLVENYDNDRFKHIDDYGHLRFGKRGGEEQFDDYGHMRFGRSV